MAHHAESYAQEGLPQAESGPHGASDEAPPGHAPGPSAAAAPPFLLMTGASILALVFGMIGACLALNLFENSSQAAPSANRPAPPAARSDRDADLKALKAHVEVVAQRVDGLKDRIDALPRSEPSSGLAILQGQVADLTKAVRETERLPAQVQSVHDQLGKLSNDILSLRHEIANAQVRLAKHEPTPIVLPAVEADEPSTAGPPVPPPVVEVPRVETAAAADNDEERLWKRAVGLFKKGKFNDALTAFNKLELARPDDARVWYYAALCRGFTTNQWTDGTEDLAERGVDREQAGSPEAGEIDLAFRDLTTASGKDWLAAYRARVKKP